MSDTLWWLLSSEELGGVIIAPTERMEKFKIIKEVGDGTFGNVWQAVNKQSGEVVAIKKMKKKYFSWDECMNLREVESLRIMNHPNIVKLKEVIRENDILFFIFEYMECNLYELMKDKDTHFSETEIRNWCFQIFQALAYIHQRGYFHRDLKPENLLCTKDIIKIADFGLARKISSLPPFTEYVSTRWYRAPEILLQTSVYSSAVDMWAMGAIMYELFTLRPLFPGSSEADEIYKICSVIGSPNQYSWAEGLHLADDLNFQFPKFARVNLSLLMPSASDDAVSLISSLCSWDPCKRPTAAEALQHRFFQCCYYIPPSLRTRLPGMTETPPSVGMKGTQEQKNGKRYPERTLPNAKLANGFASPKINASGSITKDVQRKLQMDYQELGRKEHHMQNSLKQPPYRPPVRIYPAAPVHSWRSSAKVSNVPDETRVKPAHSARGRNLGDDEPVISARSNARVSDMADKLSQLAVNSGQRQLSGRVPLSFATTTRGGMHGGRAAAA